MTERETGDEKLNIVISHVRLPRTYIRKTDLSQRKVITITPEEIKEEKPQKAADNKGE